MKNDEKWDGELIHSCLGGELYSVLEKGFSLVFSHLALKEIFAGVIRPIFTKAIDVWVCRERHLNWFGWWKCSARAAGLKDKSKVRGDFWHDFRESLQNGQLELRRRNWYFARETHKDTAVSVWACQAGFWKSTGTSCQLRHGVAKSHSLKCSLHKRAWCGAARKSDRLNCINLIHFRLTAGRLRGSSCIVIPGVVCELLQFEATQ